jgi:hypothetical protein
VATAKRREASLTAASTVPTLEQSCLVLSSAVQNTSEGSSLQPRGVSHGKLVYGRS